MKSRLFSLLVASVFVLSAAVAGPVNAEQCRDKSGKFIKCPTTTTAPAQAPAKSGKCRDASGKFAKCGTPGAKPVK